MVSAVSQDTGEVWLPLLTIHHGLLATPIRIVRNTEAITSNGDVYQPFPFDVQYIRASSEDPPQGQLVIDAIDQSVIDILRRTAGDVTVDIGFIIASEPDTIQVSATGLQWSGFSYTREAIRGQLSKKNIIDRQTPALRFTPDIFPALF